ncbi:cobalamin B12-binding domain-containing protein [Haliea sp. E17]|uniref:cobalamin B12-binding domain-containing protein n=1 Tax=Haliea sp. E17 TaxID=3401576 RepID=UPI003AAE7407
MSSGSRNRGRILVSKVGLDGHDRGVKVLARMLRDEGFEVIALGIRQTPAQVASVAKTNDVEVVGLSILSGAHVGLAQSVRRELDALGCNHVPLVVGGVIPREDAAALKEAGVYRAFHPGDTGIDPAFTATVLDELVAVSRGGEHAEHGQGETSAVATGSENIVPLDSHRARSDTAGQPPVSGATGR